MNEMSMISFIVKVLGAIQILSDTLDCEVGDSPKYHVSIFAFLNSDGSKKVML